MNAEESRQEKETRANGEGSQWARVRELLLTAAAVATVILTIIATVAAHDAAISAQNAQELFQGSDACRAIRTEIRELHQTGLKGWQITAVLRAEHTSTSYQKIKAGVLRAAGVTGDGSLAEDNYECGSKIEKPERIERFKNGFELSRPCRCMRRGHGQHHGLKGYRVTMMS